MKRIWSIDELAEHWSLKYEETQLLKSKPSRNHFTSMTGEDERGHGTVKKSLISSASDVYLQ
ncbi:hypothetical protein [Vibrio sonorensis]|uniref:hypothetical protein n=1 Tax=Vibrio sonorensis TaxID=1004316 RepID=UPI0008D9CD5B|nr:hypothetical protein [Vibrio sonorensis]